MRKEKRGHGRPGNTPEPKFKVEVEGLKGKDFLGGVGVIAKKG